MLTSTFSCAVFVITPTSGGLRSLLVQQKVPALPRRIRVFDNFTGKRCGDNLTLYV